VLNVSSKAGGEKKADFPLQEESMLRFARNKLVNVVAKNENLLAVHGVLDDDIYSCEINFEVRRPEMTIGAVAGTWHRYTTPDCPRALAEIDAVVGWCIRDPDFTHFANKVVGRKGCEHFANLIIECAAAVLEADLILSWQQARKADPALEFEAFAASCGPVTAKAAAGTRPGLEEPTPAVPAAELSTDGDLPPIPSGQGYVVDIHVHTFPASPCATDDVDAMIREAKRIGIDAICITDHNHVWPPDEIDALRQKHDFTVFRGNEITTDQGDMVVFGLHEDIQGIVPIEDLQRRVSGAGGVVIAAHPFRGFKTFNTAQLGLTVEKAGERPLFKAVDAVEVLNGKVTPAENEFARRVASNLKLPGTGGSDAHAAEEVGQCATEFPTRLRDERDLVAALKRGNCRAVAWRSAREAD